MSAPSARITASASRLLPERSLVNVQHANFCHHQAASPSALLSPPMRIDGLPNYSGSRVQAWIQQVSPVRKLPASRLAQAKLNFPFSSRLSECASRQLTTIAGTSVSSRLRENRPYISPSKPRQGLFAGSRLGSSFLHSRSLVSGPDQETTASTSEPIARATLAKPPRRDIFAGSELGSSFMASPLRSVISSLHPEDLDYPPQSSNPPDTTNQPSSEDDCFESEAVSQPMHGAFFATGGHSEAPVSISSYPEPGMETRRRMSPTEPSVPGSEFEASIPIALDPVLVAAAYPSASSVKPVRKSIFAGSELGSSFMASDPPESPAKFVRRDIFAGSELGSSFMASDPDGSEGDIYTGEEPQDPTGFLYTSIPTGVPDSEGPDVPGSLECDDFSVCS
ncbi:hypothetical protein B0I35DRAFT_218050 [Stachybotrys elegans]|uniref:Uncharacterized protein n=1 Tax=Stachybotrys elegans TaxID=80388 RepID=A0A8K0WSB8_9HYPO|nr:hypothetical protein B0I35DRAFT_218050 [Stachybotrys elegans]